MVTYEALATACLRHGVMPAVVPLVHFASTFVQPGAGEWGEFDYSRSGNPTRKSFETTLASLEGGAYALAFSTGIIAPLYRVDESLVRIMPFERVRAIKITIPRGTGDFGSGSAFDRDVYGAQQHGPLVDLRIP